jgi:hypothetical protein
MEREARETHSCGVGATIEDGWLSSIIKMRGFSLASSTGGGRKRASMVLFIMFFRRVVILAAKSLFGIRVMDAVFKL